MADTCSSDEVEEAQATVLITSSNNKPNPEHSECLICKDDLLGNDSATLHCGHIFHSLCLRRWIETVLSNSGDYIGKCPYCTVTPSPSIEGVLPLLLLWQPLPLAVDGDERFAEKIVAWELQRQNYARSERARLEAFVDKDLHYGAREYQNLIVRVDDVLVVLKRSVSLDIKQHKLVTTSRLVWRLSIEYRAITDDEHVGFSAETSAFQHHESARREIDNVPIGGSFRHGRFELWEQFAPRVERGLHDCKVNQSVDIRNSREFANYKPGSRAEVERETVLEEKGPANADNNPVYFQHDHPVDASYLEARDSIKMAIEEIQTAMEWLEKHEPGQMQTLDRGSTNLLEPCIPSACEYCQSQHRNGECLLPED